MTTKQKPTSASRKAKGAGKINLSQVLTDLEGLERMQLLQLTLIREMQHEVKRMEASAPQQTS